MIFIARSNLKLNCFELAVTAIINMAILISTIDTNANNTYCS